MTKIGNKLKSALVAALMVAGVVGLVGTLPVGAVRCPDGSEADTSAGCASQGVGNANPDGADGGQNLYTVIQNIINTIIFVIGIIAVVMIIMGGIQYSVSQGASDKVKKAKDTILYGIVGLVIAILAFAIVNFVLDGVLGS